MKELFPDPFIHLGMDEVYYRCWESNPNISQWMSDNGYTTIKEVEQYYMSKVLTSTNKIGYKSTVWQDVWDNNVTVFKDTILHLWKNTGQSADVNWQYYMQKATKEGYKVILSSPWYLNYIKYGSDWYEFYNVEPYDFEGTDEQKNLIVGGKQILGLISSLLLE